MQSSLLLRLICFCGVFHTWTEAFTSNARSCTYHVAQSPLRCQNLGGLSVKTRQVVAIPTQSVISRTLRRSSTLRALPTCAGRTSDLVRLGSLAALVGLFFQWGFTRLFRKFDKEEASYTAHSLVALVFMILLSVLGSIGWWNGGIFPSTPIDRLLVANDQCRWLAIVVTGMLTFWDLPISMSIPRLRKPDVMAHHLIMSITAFVAAVYLPMFYVFFYLGVSEISSIPLVVYDQLSVWSSNATGISGTLPNNGSEADDFATEKRQSTLVLTRTVFQMMAAVCFTAIRAVAFTFITLRYFIPDVLHVLAQSPLRTPVATALRFALGASIGFTALQLYWFALMVRTILSQSSE